MNKEKILEIIKCGENSRVQFKEHFTTQKQMAEELVAMANAKGGMIIIGCKDKTGEIVGLCYDEVQMATEDGTKQCARGTAHVRANSIGGGNDGSHGLREPYFIPTQDTHTTDRGRSA